MSSYDPTDETRYGTEGRTAVATGTGDNGHRAAHLAPASEAPEVTVTGAADPAAAYASPSPSDEALPAIDFADEDADAVPYSYEDEPAAPADPPKSDEGERPSEFSRTVDEAPAPVNSPGHDAAIDVESREDSESISGKSSRLAWGIRSDVGLVRSHNEDSYLARAPLFAVCDGMGGHAAGEVASSIAVQTLAEEAPATADDVLLGAAVETANAAVIRGAAEGKGKPGMGSTCTCAIIDGNRMSIAHVGDSRLYLLHAGTLVRLTHDHSYVEELVDAGEITADEARVHPSRSVITRALGSDPAMYADHFTLNVSVGDRVIICSDGLSGMVEDSLIEGIAVSTATPQQAADSLVSEALAAGGHDNVTVIVVDVLDDGLAETHRARRMRRLFYIVISILAVAAVLAGVVLAYVNSSWYLGEHDGKVTIYHGVNSSFAGIQLSRLDTETSVAVTDLPQTVQEHLKSGIAVSSEDEARKVIDDYRSQIDAAKTDAAQKAQAASGDGSGDGSSDSAAGSSADDSDAPSSGDAIVATDTATGAVFLLTAPSPEGGGAR